MQPPIGEFNLSRLERVIYGGRVMLIDTNNRILDKFFLDEE